VASKAAELVLHFKRLSGFRVEFRMQIDTHNHVLSSQFGDTAVLDERADSVVHLVWLEHP
jgi:hypothetical protein